jgi:hypothetical protein
MRAKQPEQKRNHVGAEAGQRDALVGHQRAVAGLRDLGGGDVEKCMLESALDARTRLKFLRYRTWTPRWRKSRHVEPALSGRKFAAFCFVPKGS